MKKLFKFLANRKGSAFIETLMVYVCVALIGVAVVGVVGKTVKDAAAGSPYQEEITTTLGDNAGENDGETPDSGEEIPTVASFNLYLWWKGEDVEITYEEGMTWFEWSASDYADDRLSVNSYSVSCEGNSITYFADEEMTENIRVYGTDKIDKNIPYGWD